MNFLREKVSGNKKRYKDEDFNLDLSYITPKVIAMAFPGEGIRKLYRNSIHTVKEFLDKKHPGKSLVINISGEKYTYDLFENKVKEYDWIDHQAPKLSVLFEICKEMYSFCLSDPESVVAVNCRAGKGRTGTVICCFMLFSGIFTDPKDALDYYSIKRFQSGEGVTQPSQKRYVYFFHEILTKKIFYPLVITIKGIYIYDIPKLDQKESIKTYFDLYLENSDKLEFSTKKNYSDQMKIYAEKKDLVKITEEDFSYSLVGDFTICINENQFSTDKLIGRISYNTAFMNPEGGFLNFNLQEIDPDNLVKKKSYSKDFTISVSIF
jgi:phosphatidylinositol-3,4,5-trisphosphate 3-phosphatase/dual-specificity protein phosphatase PTEN